MQLDAPAPLHVRHVASHDPQLNPLWYTPFSVQAPQWPSAYKKLPTGQDAHWVGRLPEQVAQEGLHVPQTPVVKTT